MRALARVVARADGHGGTRLTELRGESPLLLRQTPGGTGALTVYVVGGAAGPLAGDDLRLEIEVGPGAALRVCGVAASVALPGRPGAVSRMQVHAVVGAGGALHWLPEQLVAARGCAHLSEARVKLAAGATLSWRDELICGRYDEPAGNATVYTSVDHDGRPLLRQSLAVGPDAPGWDGPAVLGGARATGSLLLVEPTGGSRSTAVHPGGSAARLPLHGSPATLFTATAPDARLLRDQLTPELWS
ncbi:urease accessory protein UreD [Micromonospora sp. CPCC 206060]|uniref:urease accessory protein UreD n=1 Tax=Micromonospora sp. CPCC 206060 TaxID=3122406 RepID=UPI002FF03BA9